jgi:hypothetical protein
MFNDLKSLGEIIGLYDSFLTIWEGTIYFMYQSMKNYLIEYINIEICSDRYRRVAMNSVRIDWDYG